MSTVTDPTERFTVRKDGARIVAFVCDVVLYTSADLTSIRDGVLWMYERFLAMCPPGTPKWYSTENMTKDKPCTPRALDMLRGWLKPGAPHRKVIHIQLSDGVRFDDAGEYTFWVYGEEPGKDTYGAYVNVLRCSFPGRWGLEHAADLQQFAVQVCEAIPFLSGHAGYALEISEYARSASHVGAWQLSMQHPGLDIANPVADSVALQRSAIKGVNWLTMLGREFVAQLSGIEGIRHQLPETATVIPVRDGVVIKAQDKPAWGHVNRNDRLPAYQAVYALVEPLQAPIIQRYTAFSLPGGNHRAQTQAWLRRFGRDAGSPP